MSDSQSSLDTYTFVILVFAFAVAAATAGLTYWAEMSVPLALLAGGTAGGASMLWVMKVFKRPSPAKGAEKHGDGSVAR